MSCEKIFVFIKNLITFYYEGELTFGILQTAINKYYIAYLLQCLIVCCTIFREFNISAWREWLKRFALHLLSLFYQTRIHIEAFLPSLEIMSKTMDKAQNIELTVWPTVVVSDTNREHQIFYFRKLSFSGFFCIYI